MKYISQKRDYEMKNTASSKRLMLIIKSLISTINDINTITNVTVPNVALGNWADSIHRIRSPRRCLHQCICQIIPPSQWFPRRPKQKSSASITLILIKSPSFLQCLLFCIKLPPNLASVNGNPGGESCPPAGSAVQGPNGSDTFLGPSSGRRPEMGR